MFHKKVKKLKGNSETSIEYCVLEEASNKIIDDILQGTTKSKNIKTISNRREAIQFTLDEMAKRKSMNILLLAGKGHENYQIIGSKKNRFDDKETLISLTKLQLCC